MPKTVDNYLIRKQLFKDCFEIDYLQCEHKVLKKPFTLKKIQRAADDCHSKDEEKHKIKLSFAYSCIQNEVQISRQLKSEKVIRCLKILKAKNAIYAVYDQHPERTLQKILSTEYLTTQKKQTILNEIIQLIRQLHDSDIALGNIQPANIFITSDYKVQISNFLIARKVDDYEEAQVDQLFLDSHCSFYAPQLLKSGFLTKAADMYSLGQIIKALKFEKTDNDLLSPVKFSCQNIRDFVDRMIDENPINRPTIIQFEKSFRLNKSRNKSTCGSSGSRDIEEKMADVRGLESYKSEATLKFFNQKLENSKLLHQESKKALLNKGQTLNQDLLDIKPKKIALKSRATLEFSSPSQCVRKDTLQVPNIRKSRDCDLSKSNKSIKSGSSSPRLESSIAGSSQKQKYTEITLTRNLVSFLIQMALFVQGQQNSKDLSYYLIQEAINYTNNLLETLQKLAKDEDWACKGFVEFVEQCQREKRKLNEIAFFFNHEAQNKNYHQIHMIEELKKFGKVILSTYSSDFSIHSRVSQVSDNVCKSKRVIECNKAKQNEQKMFKTFMILKRLQYGNYLDFFKAKVHHPNKKFWNQHYFEFQKTFGGKYFAIQIKDLINKK